MSAATRTRRPTYAEPELELYPDRVDVPLPYDESGETSPVPLEEVDRLRIALAEAVAYVESGRPAPGNRMRAWRDLIPKAPAIAAGSTPWDEAIDGIERAAARWNDEEVAAVDQAIRDVAARTLAAAAIDDGPATFTTADVWAELGPGFTVTKGIAGRMLAAKAAGLIVNTGATVVAPKDAPGPNHGQRLTVWQAIA